MLNPRLFLAPISIAAWVFAAAFVCFEYFNGGVQTHHVLARSELPGFSNWLSLLVVPLLGVAVAYRSESTPGDAVRRMGFARIAPALIGALVYGAAMAMSFHLGLRELTGILFQALLLCAVLFPVYRVEYIFGFVVGMTISFGSVIPLIIALVLAVVSFVVRHGGWWLWMRMRGAGKSA